MSPSHLHQMNVTENDETTSIPDDHTTKDQNELDRYQTSKSPMM